MGWARTHSIKGSVHLFSDGSPMANIRVVLAVFPELTVATTYTLGSGDFEFANLPDGDYQIIVEDQSYGSVHQTVAVQASSVYGVQIYLHGTASVRSAPAGSVVSVRELSLRRKAREAMDKGLYLLYRKSDYRGSLKEFERAIKDYPGYYEAYAKMGVAHMNLQDSASSEAALRKSIELSAGKHAEAYFLLATLFSNTGRFAGAEQFARCALDLDPALWQAHSELARALLGVHRPAEAEESASEAVRLQPERALLRLLLADIHVALNNHVALLHDLDDYLRLAPTGPMADQARRTREQLQQAMAEATTPAQPALQSPENPKH
jgi:tetratricopeptide (TPR) repeat protein